VDFNYLNGVLRLICLELPLFGLELLQTGEHVVCISPFFYSSDKGIDRAA